MIALCYLLAGLLALSLGVNGWLTYRAFAAVDKRVDARVGQVLTEAEAERTSFELKNAQAALASADHVIDGLEDTLASYLTGTTNTDLAADDVDGRVLRLAQRLGQAARAGRPVHPDADEAVPPDPATEPAAADLSSPTGLADV